MSNKERKKTAAAAKEKRIMLIFNAVLVAALLCIFLVPKILNHQRYHIVQTDASGAVKGLQDHWLVIDLPDGETKRYSHLADVSPAPGYALRGTGYLTDANVRTIYFTSDGELPEYTVTSAHGAYDVQAEAFRAHQDLLLTEVLHLEEIQTGQVGKWRTAAFWVNGTIDDLYDEAGNAVTPARDADGNPVYPQKYEQAAYCYLESPVSDTSVLLSVTLFNRQENAFPEPSAMMELLLRAAEGVRYP